MGDETGMGMEGTKTDSMEDGSEPLETGGTKWDRWGTGQNCRGEVQGRGKGGRGIGGGGEVQ